MLYFERRMCTFTRQPIDAKDKSSVQILLAKLDQNGRMTSEAEVDIIDIAGTIRKNGQSNELMLEYARNNQ